MNLNSLVNTTLSEADGVFTLKNETKTIITKEDLKSGLNVFLSFNKKEDNSVLHNLYV